jgi:hypothetical protein
VRFALIACLVACAADRAPPVEPRPVAPGPLSQSHEAIDNQLGCNDCHVSGTPALANEKCLACHAPISDRIVQRAGLHGSSQVRDKACWECHGEHRGRRYDPRGWQALPGGERGFDHERTGWPLRARHGVARCEQCHPRTNTQGLRVYLGAERACIACHEQDEPHRTRLACERCHLVTAWKPVKRLLDLDHPPTLPLEGAHAKVACTRCHTDHTFALPVGDCATCHVDPHDGDAFDELDCKRCHAVTAPSFRVISFDHQEATKRSLRMHRKIRCVDCHARPAVATCAGCHAGVQPAGRAITRHGNRFGATACQDCHTLTGWRARVFDHRTTKFPLRWGHAVLTCRACHRGGDPATFEDLGKQTSCTGCHAHAKVHDNKYEQRQCLMCHHGY